MVATEGRNGHVNKGIIVPSRLSAGNVRTTPGLAACNPLSKLTDNAKYASSSLLAPSPRRGMYPLTLVHARLNGLLPVPVDACAAAESSWTEFAQRNPESWLWNDDAAFADIAAGWG